jgi:hypothetical protein
MGHALIISARIPSAEDKCFTAFFIKFLFKAFFIVNIPWEVRNL